MRPLLFCPARFASLIGDRRGGSCFDILPQSKSGCTRAGTAAFLHTNAHIKGLS
nr:MAG TPA: hypothetical protein [Caudoviricetes sp.]DAS15520.1 MAG TPA: hypothetical protein [Caudoviricetes sp.]